MGLPWSFRGRPAAAPSGSAASGPARRRPRNDGVASALRQPTLGLGEGSRLSLSVRSFGISMDLISLSALGHPRPYPPHIGKPLGLEHGFLAGGAGCEDTTVLTTWPEMLGRTGHPQSVSLSRS
jgi:hypothetical protein